MASLSSLSALLSFSPCFQTKTKASISSNKRHVVVTYVSCKAASNNGEDSVGKFDRRDVLFGLGGFYGVTALVGNNFALAADQSLSPDVLNCKKAIIPGGSTMDCCAPNIKEIINFIPPVVSNPRVRPAVHLMNPTQIRDLEKGILLMMKLGKDDPRSFEHQAKIHCAYCDYAYSQVGSNPKADFQTHFNALFFPFHRAYLYFFERILCDLLAKPDFAIPFWNWDSPPGMFMPKIYNKPGSSLYDENRDERHQPSKLLNLNYDGTENPPFDVVDCNLRWMNKRMSVKTPEEFFGKILKLGETASYAGSGSIEISPHNNIHDWVGNPKNPNGEDMGTFYSAGRDPLFYAHHGNVDRMWNIWQNMEDHSRDFTDDGWLNSTFVLYNEKQEAVRIKVSDCLDSEKLGYVYQDVEIPWKDKKQIPRRNPWKRTKDSEPPVIKFPQILDSDITTMVERPSSGERIEGEEVLVLEDLEFDSNSPLHFNVLVNVGDKGEDVCPGNVEFVGTFRNIPHGLEQHEKTSLHFKLTNVIQELGLVGEKKLAVKIVPKVNGDRIKIGGIKIEFEAMV